MKNDLPEATKLLIEQIVKELSQLFGVEPISPSVRIAGSRAEMDRIKERPTEPWLVGTVKDGVIYLLDKDRFETESDHPKSDFEKVLKHEIAHLYITAVAGTNKPFWLNEGIACYLAGQVKTRPSSENVVRLKDYYDKLDPSIYQLGYFWVSYLADTFGMAKIMEFLREWKQAEQNPEEFAILFERYFSFGLDETQLLEQIKKTGAR
jgi:hypothetical protein